MTLPADQAVNHDLETDLGAERAHLAESRDALRWMRERAASLFGSGKDVAGDAYTAETLGRILARRVAELADDPTTPLFFGRLDFGRGAAAEDHAGHRYHVGRRHVTDDAGEPMVLDWRAPVSRAFYRASASDPNGLVRADLDTSICVQGAPGTRNPNAGIWHTSKASRSGSPFANPS